MTTRETNAAGGTMAWGHRALLVALAAAVLLPGASVAGLFERDEAAYAQMGREMLESGEWLVPRYLGQPWLGKPPLLIWLTATSFRLFGVGEWQARVVSIAAMGAAVLLVGELAARMYGRRAGLPAGLLFLTCGLAAVVGRLLLTDSLLLAFVLVAALTHWRMAAERVTHVRAAVYWLAITLGLLTKGPAILLFAGAFAVALLCTPGLRSWVIAWRWWAWMPLAVVMAGAWYLGALRSAGSLAHEQLLWREIVMRVLQPQQGHAGPPGYYVLMLLGGLLPWTPFLPGTLVWAWRRRRADAAARVMLIWLVVPWIALELMQTKLPHYALPCCVPLSILLGAIWAKTLDRTAAGGRVSAAADAPHSESARPVPAAEGRAADAERAVLRLWVAIPIALGLVLCGAAGRWHSAGWAPAVAIAGAVLGVGFAAAGLFVRRNALVGALVSAVVTMCVFYAVVGSLVLPAFEPYRLSRRVAERVNALAPPGAEIAACEYEEPTMFFYMHRPARVLPVSQLAEAFRAAEGPVFFVSRDRNWRSVGIEPGSPGAAWESVSGFNLGRSRNETVWLAQRRH